MPAGRPSFNTEERLTALEKKLITLYNRKYRNEIRSRRAGMRKVENYRMLLLRKTSTRLQRYEGMLHRLSMLLAKRPKNKVAVYLTPAENVKFRCWLKTDHRKNEGKTS